MTAELFAHRFDPPLVAATFVRRPHRFAIEARLVSGGRRVLAHLPDPGRLRELLWDGATVWLQPANAPGRKTSFSARLVVARNGSLVGLDTQLPNKLVAQALRQGTLEEFSDYELDRAEYSHGDSRYDFLLRALGGPPCILEVKSVTLAVDGVGRFPDAVTTRGRRHVSGLTAWASQGHDAAILFVVQRSDVRRVEAAAEIDPEFAAALAAAAKAGVRLLARSCALSPQGVRWGPRLELAAC